MPKQKILFYDIDGCLHPQGVATEIDCEIYRGVGDGLFVWAPILAELIAPYPDLKLVCHSTWRNLYTIEQLVSKHLPLALASRWNN